MTAKVLLKITRTSYGRRYECEAYLPTVSDGSPCTMEPIPTQITHVWYQFLRISTCMFSMCAIQYCCSIDRNISNVNIYIYTYTYVHNNTQYILISYDTFMILVKHILPTIFPLNIEFATSVSWLAALMPSCPGDSHSFQTWIFCTDLVDIGRPIMVNHFWLTKPLCFTICNIYTIHVYHIKKSLTVAVHELLGLAWFSMRVVVGHGTWGFYRKRKPVAGW